MDEQAVAVQAVETAQELIAQQRIIDQQIADALPREYRRATAISVRALAGRLQTRLGIILRNHRDYYWIARYGEHAVVIRHLKDLAAWGRSIGVLGSYDYEGLYHKFRGHMYRA